MNFKISYDTKNAAWIDKMLAEDKAVNIVEGIIPAGFERYIKVFFPVGILLENDNIQSKTYKEIASLAYLPYSNSFSYTDLTMKFGGIPSDFIVLKEQDDFLVDELISILDGNTDTVFYGFGDDILPEVFLAPWIIEDKLAILKDVFKELNINAYHEFSHFPEYIFPKDKSWCIGTRILDSGMILIGCNSQVADLILASKTIDSVELNYTDKYFTFLKLPNS
jgi:hypothetical protein